jgi:hypothetical protein
MRRSMVPLALAVALCAGSRAAWGDAEIAVTRGDAAEQCPSATELRRLAMASQAPATEPPTHAYRVAFERSGSAYRADIVDETSPRIRSLADRGPGCAPLGQAVAVVLATMWGSEREDREETTRVSEPTSAPPALAPTVPETPRPCSSGEPGRAPGRTCTGASRTRWILGAGAGLAAAIVRPAAPSFLTDVALERTSLSIALGAFWIPPQHLALGPGIVDVQLLAGAARGCVFAGHKALFGACTRLFAGALQAGGSGYDVNARETRPWFAAALEIFAAGPLPLASLRGRASVGAIAPLHAEAFSVAGKGTAYDTPAFGALFTLSLEVGL